MTIARQRFGKNHPKAGTTMGCKRQTCRLVRKSAPHQQTRQLSNTNKNLVTNPRWVLYSTKDLTGLVGKNPDGVQCVSSDSFDIRHVEEKTLVVQYGLERVVGSN
jgi:hypothetical protein